MQYTTNVTTTDGTETVAARVVDDETIPYPPHQWLAGVVVTIPVRLDEGGEQIGLEDRIGALIPISNAGVTAEQYLEHLSKAKPATILMLTMALGTTPVETNLTWFVLRETTGENEDRVAHYTPATEEELKGWLDAETFAESVQAEIAFGGGED